MRLATVAQQGEHVVHLAVDSAGIAAAAVHFFEDHRGFGQAQARPAVLHRNHRRQPAGVGQSLDEGFREALFFINLAPVSSIELGTQGAHAFADGVQFVVVVGIH